MISRQALFTFLPFYFFTLFPFYLFTFITTFLLFKAPPFKQKKGAPSDAPNCNIRYKITLQSEQ